MQTVLLVDDNSSYLHHVESLLKDRYSVVTAGSGTTALEILRVERISIVLLGMLLSDSDRLDLLKTIHTHIDPHLPVILVTDFANTESIVEAMRFGACDVVSTDFHRDVVFEKVRLALERRTLEIKANALQSSFADMHDRFVFGSGAMKKLNFELTRLANVNFDLLITGESGVGKDLVAYEIHKRSPRAERAFIPLPMKALSESLVESELFGHEKGSFSGADKAKIGKLESADGGTVYIPEVSTLSESVQLKLLHFMQYKTVTRVGQDPRKPETKLDVRLIMATNEALEEVVNSRKMRLDFYHRITGVKITVPPLRDRIEDIEPLVKYFSEKHARSVHNEEHEFSPEVIAAFKAYRWPGNVRELENVVKNALAYTSNKVLTVDDFSHFAELKTNPDDCRICMSTRFRVMPPYDVAEMEFKRAYFSEVLHRTGNRVSQAAAIAGLTYQGVRKIMKALGLKEE